MIKRIILYTILLSSICWLIFVAKEILSDKNNYDESLIFGTEDSILFIINRSDEIKEAKSIGLKNKTIEPIINSLLTTKFNAAFISGKRNHILIKKDNNWDKKSIKHLLNEKVNFESNEFKTAKLSGRFNKKSLYIYEGKEYKKNNTPLDLNYDKKASASRITLGKKNSIKSSTDLYFTSRNKTNYIPHNTNIKKGHQINDQAIFSHILSNRIKNYHFFERDYYATQDSIFLNSPMLKWMKNGFLEVNINNKKAIISDYIEGQDPILILNDLNQTIDSNNFKNKLTSSFPIEDNSYFIKYIDDLVVISEDEKTCDQLIADFKLGNTVSLNQNYLNLIYGQLPKNVSERFIGEDAQYSKSIYKGKILETQINDKSIKEIKIEKETITYNCEFDIIDFITYNKSKSVVSLGKNGEIKSFKNGTEIWKDNINDKVIGSLKIIDLNDDNNYYTLINTSNKIYLWNELGDQVSGFPINIDSELINEVKFYRWKGKSYFIVANAEKEIMHFDSKGRELNIFSTDINVTRKIDVWVSNKILFAGLANENNFRMINLNQYKVHREFNLPSESFSAKIPNELLQFGFDNEMLFKIDQKGSRTNFTKFSRGKIKTIIPNNKNPIIVIQDGNEIILLNINGIPFASLNIPFNEIESVYVTVNENNETIIGIIDGLENNLYFYNSNGQKINTNPIEGQTKITNTPLNDEYLITTVIDQFIIQYFIK